jgi:hypothetical protein
VPIILLVEPLGAEGRGFESLRPDHLINHLARSRKLWKYAVLGGCCFRRFETHLIGSGGMPGSEEGSEKPLRSCRIESDVGLPDRTSAFPAERRLGRFQPNPAIRI